MTGQGALIRLPVRRAHLAALFALNVRPDQRDLVASNVKTLAEAAYEEGAQVWGLWLGEKPVGLMAMVDFRKATDLLPGDDPTAAYLWRLMIAADSQGQGLGRTALGMAIDTARDWGFDRLKLGVADLDHSNIGFYRRFGFQETGEVIDGDRMMTLALPPKA
ncbi:GNAT family N-acetyltransferase [Thioclava sp. FR2]|uniref:GNAT family N-acetyltransferase n=1 Tax=Thioclava sp. FR2 TaxID=3445780 RepID=UPI003EBF66FC